MEGVKLMKTDGNIELWDAYKDDFTKIDRMILQRGKSIPQGIYHLVCEIIVKHFDGSYLLMQRDFKKHLGGLWEATAGGSAISGETPFECAKRELKEETGIRECNLSEIGRVVHYSHQTIYYEFLAEVSIDKDSIILQEGETISYKWVSKEELKCLSNNVLATKRIINFIDELSH